MFAALASGAACVFLWLRAPSDPNADERAMPSLPTPPGVTPTASAVAFDLPPDSKTPEPPLGMVYVPPATFAMGSDGDGANERPAHAVTISNGFFLDEVEVRASDYAACVAVGECRPSHFGALDLDAQSTDGDAETAGGAETATTGCNLGDDLATARRPANCIDQEEAIAYCAYSGMRLPTEAEWELAARHVDDGAYAEGDVWEWVADGYEAYPAGDVTDPLISARARGVLRGGDDSVGAEHATIRRAFDRDAAEINTGFRCAKDVQ